MRFRQRFSPITLVGAVPSLGAADSMEDARDERSGCVFGRVDDAGDLLGQLVDCHVRGGASELIRE